MSLSFSLQALSPLDGRYSSSLKPLAEIFSEAALIKQRVIVEITYLLFLSQKHIIPPFTLKQKKLLEKRMSLLSNEDLFSVKRHEDTTHHDVKAVEYFLRDILSELKIDASQYIHICLTSEDVNSIAYGVMLTNANNIVVLPAVAKLLNTLITLSNEYKSIPMLARTHGQPAVPTTVGKECIVFATRIHNILQHLQKHVFEAKLSGAVGNYNAHVAGFPKIDWVKLSQKFVQSFGLNYQHFSTQIVAADNIVQYFQHLQLLNSILIGLDQDMWRYISDEYFTQRAERSRVGSSTMPQKVNPIDFENSEGNLGIANALIAHFCEKLPISRLQRDLSDSTVKRNFGVALGHCVLGYTSCVRGLSNITPNREKLEYELLSHFEVVTEGIQTVLRASGQVDAYEKLKNFSRGKQVTQKTLADFIDSLAVDDQVKERLRDLTPLTYLGLAEKIVQRGIRITTHTKKGGA